MSSSPTPSEREAADKSAAAREAEEQAKLPYKWMQTIQDVDLTAQVPGNLKARDFDIKITKDHLRVAVKGQDPIIDVGFAPSALPGLCLIIANRAISLTPSMSMNLPGPWRPLPQARNSLSTSTRSTRWNGGPTLSRMPPR